VGGLTKNQAEEKVRDGREAYLAASENPIVTVRNVELPRHRGGRSGQPESDSVSTEKMSIIEALAQARADLSIYGKRNNVLLIREDATGRTGPSSQPQRCQHLQLAY
jgi:polysaccharide export outer membrane protein